MLNRKFTAGILAMALSLSVQTILAEPAAARAAAACGPRGCAAVRTGPNHRPGYHPGVRPPAYRRGVVVVNPHRYWRPGGAIAAGAAVGFVAGAAAVSLAGQPPQSGYCWYYTNSSKTTGFWDVCPR